MNDISAAVILLLIGSALVSMNLSGNPDDRSFWGGWLSIIVGFLFLVRWFFGIM